jgi:hypothetical protein
VFQAASIFFNEMVGLGNAVVWAVVIRIIDLRRGGIGVKVYSEQKPIRLASLPDDRQRYTGWPGCAMR